MRDKKEKKNQMSYQELMTKYKEMLSRDKISQQEISTLKSENSSLKNENSNLKVKVENQQLQINSLNRMLFGSKREATPKQEENLVEGTQCSIFGVPEDEEIQKQIKEKTEEITVYRKKKNKKKYAGIKKAELKNIETVIEEYVLNLAEDKCPICSSELKQIGKKVVRQEIEFVPAKLKLKNYVQYVYKCINCGTEDRQKDTPTIVKSKIPEPLLTHSFASPSLATEVIYQKYYLGVPLYRQEKMWDDKGLVLPRNMMANWIIKISEYYLEPIYQLMSKHLKQNNQLLHCDETTMQCNKEPGRNASNKSYMWVIRSGELEKQKGVIFKYSASRSAKVAEEFLEGFSNILVTDGYSGYNNLEVKTHAECWAHARRYFYESIPLLDNKKMDTSCDGYEGVEYCDKLFKIEEKIAKFSVEEKKKVRQEESKPILDAFFGWVENTLTTKVVLNKKLKEALTYANNQKKELSEFLNDGQIPLTNSAAERAVRPFAVHRKNWLFADSISGANANAVMYSLIESAKINNINIYKYINYLLEKLPQLEDATEEEVIRKYLPWSKELPEDILNFQCAYKELTVAE